MQTAIVYTALLACIGLIIGLCARRAGRAEKELEYAKKLSKSNASAGEILNRYVNMSSVELNQRVLDKRERAIKRLRYKNRLDR